MIGKTNLPLRTGGWIIPVETTDSTNKILTVNVPAGSKIMCANCTLENQSTLASNGSILATTNGFVINKDINGLKILRPLVETPAMTILRGNEILYSDNGVKRISLLAPVTGTMALIVYRNELHALMGGGSYTGHYKWNGEKWINVSTLPYQANRAHVIVYHDELHLLGGTMTGTGTNHFKWNGIEWTSVSTIPVSFAYGDVVVYNGNIHIVTDASNGTSTITSLYKWDGAEWTKVSDVPYQLFNGGVTNYNNEIHIFGGYSTAAATYHYKWNGTEWTSVSTLPVRSNNGWKALVYNNNLYAVSASDLYRFENGTWVKTIALPYSLSSINLAICVYDGMVNIMGSSGSNHFVWSDSESTWRNYRTENAFNLPRGFRVNGVICNTTGENIVPRKNNYLIEF